MVKVVPYAIITFLISVAFIWYGSAQFEKGRASCKLKAAEQAVLGSTEKVKSDAKYKAMPTPDLVKHGYERGWLRSRDNR